MNIYPRNIYLHGSQIDTFHVNNIHGIYIDISRIKYSDLSKKQVCWIHVKNIYVGCISTFWGWSASKKQERWIHVDDLAKF